MQKYMKILERNVQWIALGLGGIYLLWMVWAYLINTPVSVKLGNKDAYPENVEEEIYADKGKQLELAMKRTDTISIPTSDVLTPYLAKLDEKDVKDMMFATQWYGPRGEPPEGANNINVGANGLFAKLPALPPAGFADESHSITTVLLDQGAAPANPAVQPVIAPQDTNWVSLRFKINMNDVYKSFGDAFKGTDLPRLFVTKFLQVELLRQEKMPNGTWSEPTTVPTHSAADALGYPGDTVNPVGAARQAAYEYKNSISKQQKALLTPTFPKVADGAPAWFQPGQNAPDKGRGAGARPGVVPPRPAAAPAKAPPAAPLFVPPAAAGNNPGAGQLQEGEIDLASANGEMEIVLHDLTAEDGKTYRYAIRYKLANPVWDSGNNLAVQALTQQLALVSPISEWSKEINIESHTRIFVTNVNGRSGRVSFDLFEWKDKQYHRSKVDAGAGDPIKAWTVVDVRADPRDSYVLLMGPDGKLEKHSKRADSEDPKYEELKLKTNQAAALAK